MWDNKFKAVTLSYDDGVKQDKKLVDILNKYNIKCTFNLNSGMLYNECIWEKDGVPVIRMTPEECIETFKGHEIAAHSLTHPDLCTLGDYELERQVMGDKKLLEYIFKNRVYGMAYPGGGYDKRVKDVIEKSGLLYCRTIKQSENFEVPTDFMEVNPTCRHKNPKLLQLAEEFVNLKTDKPQIFYLWGHSYEFDVDKNWDIFEEFCRIIGGKDDIYYCTNIEAFSPFLKSFCHSL